MSYPFAPKSYYEDEPSEEERDEQAIQAEEEHIAGTWERLEETLPYDPYGGEKHRYYEEN